MDVTDSLAVGYMVLEIPYVHKMTSGHICRYRPHYILVRMDDGLVSRLIWFS